jgi:prepilin-type N-terminal cleavage/methylation domain-containing protein
VHAFTLIELIVVVVILAVVAGAVVPRFSSGAWRRAETTAVALREAVSTAATRAALYTQPAAIVVDSKERTAQVLSFVPGAGRDWDRPGSFIADPLSPKVELDDVEILRATIDGVPVRAEQFRVDFRPGARPPSISIVVAQTGGTRAWRIDLESGSMRTSLTPSERADAARDPGASTVDLDGLGREEEPW